MITKYLTQDGDGSTRNANVDGTTPEVFYVKPPATRIYEIVSLIIIVGDDSIDLANYGNISALSNGVTIRVLNDDDVVLEDLLDGNPIKTNSQFYHFSPKVENNDTFLQIYWPLDQKIVLESDERLEVTIQDNLTGLTDHYFIVSGSQR